MVFWCFFLQGAASSGPNFQQINTLSMAVGSYAA